jgi:inosine-uridine nucleoside N-ribohydrolase
MQRVICDCDNTIGLPARDVDDALAILYLLGREDVELAGITATYGNATVGEVMGATKAMFEETGLKPPPLFRGAASARERSSEAAVFLAESVRSVPGKIKLLATGSFTNLAGAYEHDPSFFDNVQEIVVMGGITEELVIGGRMMKELNVSCDPEAAQLLFGSHCPLTVVTGNLCAQILLGRERYLARAGASPDAGAGIYRYLRQKIISWFDVMKRRHGLAGFHPWDAVASVYLTNPELFSTSQVRIVSSLRELESGLLSTIPCRADQRCSTLPVRIDNQELFWETLFSSWENISMPVV